MEELAELPTHILCKRDFNGGAKNCRLFIGEIGAEKVAKYYNDRAAQSSKWDSDRVLSYWAGYQSVLKEFENAN